MSQVILDMSKLLEIERKCGMKADEVIGKIAQDCERYIKEHFSTSSPSPAGSPPGVDTGALKNSILAEPGDDGWMLHDGVEYGVWLEYGTENMAARPWMLPGVEAVTNNLPPGLLKEVVDDQ